MTAHSQLPSKHAQTAPLRRLQAEPYRTEVGSQRTSSARRHCPPFSNAEMRAVYLRQASGKAQRQLSCLERRGRPGMAHRTLQARLLARRLLDGLT